MVKIRIQGDTIKGQLTIQANDDGDNYVVSKSGYLGMQIAADTLGEAVNMAIMHQHKMRRDPNWEHVTRARRAAREARESAAAAHNGGNANGSHTTSAANTQPAIGAGGTGQAQGADAAVDPRFGGNKRGRKASGTEATPEHAA